MQASANKLAPDQLAGLAGAGGAGRGRGGQGSIPNMTSNQVSALMQFTGAGQQPTQNLNAARAALVSASLADPRNDAEIRQKQMQSPRPNYRWQMSVPMDFGKDSVHRPRSSRRISSPH